MVIQFEHYTKIIRGNIVLDDVNLVFKSGLVYGLQGVNGSGKTMLMRAACGLIIATRGKLLIDGKILSHDISFPPSVGALIEKPSFISNYTGFQNLKTLASIRKVISDAEIKTALASVGLDAADKRTFRKYSLGMKQKLGIAAAIMENPELLILDEPLNGIDKSGVVLIKNLVRQHKERGALILLTCHSQDELLELSDEIISIESGKIISPKSKEEQTDD